MPNAYGLMDCSIGEVPNDEKQKKVFTTRFECHAKANYDPKVGKWIIDKHGIENDDVKVLYWVPADE